jgi:hypothetical protein
VIRGTYRAACSSVLAGVNNEIKTLALQGYGHREETFFILKRLSRHQGRIKLAG